MSVNKTILIGHLGRDPDIRHTQAGKRVASFRIATSESWKDKATGERKQHTDWHNVVIFHDGLAELAEKYLKKGSKVYVEGASKTRKYKDKDGVDRWVTEIVLTGFHSQLQVLDRAERATAPGEDAYGEGDSREPPAPAGKRDDMDDEIPF